MPAPHSSINEKLSGVSQYLDIPSLPFNESSDPNIYQAIDEALSQFKAIVLFKNYEIKGDADRLLMYLVLYIHKCLLELSAKKPNKENAFKMLETLSIQLKTVPGDPNFPLQAYFKTGYSGDYPQYMEKVRKETGKRLVEKVYSEGPQAPSKWWLAFSKRKFMNQQLKDGRF